MPVSTLDVAISPNSPPIQHFVHLLKKHKGTALFKTFRHMKKRISVSPHQSFLHLPLGPLFSPIGQGWFRRSGARTILSSVFGSSEQLADNSHPELILSSAFIFTKRMVIYINVNMKTRIEKKFILIYFITSLWYTYCNKNIETLLRSAFRIATTWCTSVYQLALWRVATSFIMLYFFVSNQRMM